MEVFFRFVTIGVGGGGEHFLVSSENYGDGDVGLVALWSDEDGDAVADGDSAVVVVASTVVGVVMVVVGTQVVH